MSYDHEDLVAMFEQSLDLGDDIATALKRLRVIPEVARSIEAWEEAKKLPQTEESHAALTVAGNTLARLAGNGDLQALIEDETMLLSECAELWWLTNPPPEEIESM